jgi:homogentisate 1,2-dioxygenase
MNIEARNLKNLSGSEVESLEYQTGFGNEFASEAVAGALPLDQNSPQIPPFSLYSELVSGSTFSAPRALNRRSYLFRIRPSTLHGEFREIDAKTFVTPPFSRLPSPDAYRWRAFALPNGPVDFLDSMLTLCGNGSPMLQQGMSMHIYRATKSMDDRVFANSDGEMLIMPETGAVSIFTEFGLIEVKPGEVALIPKGVKFRVDLLEESARGYVCENYGAMFRLPELGIIGSYGLANAMDFKAPVAAFEDKEAPTQFVHKYCGRMWAVDMGFSLLDVVAWRGTLTPCKYDLRRFVAMGSLTVDHPDPSLFTVLTSPSDPVAGPNADFLAVTPKWSVSERSLRVAGFHRNTVVEFSGILNGGGVLQSGGAHINNNWVPHGPEPAVLDAGRNAKLAPERSDDGIKFLVETRFPLQVADAALAAPERLTDLSVRFAGYGARRDSLPSD